MLKFAQQIWQLFETLLYTMENFDMVHLKTIYPPTWRVPHGIQSFKAISPEERIVPNFDADTTWKETLKILK